MVNGSNDGVLEDSGHSGETHLRSTQCAVQALNNVTVGVQSCVFLLERYRTLVRAMYWILV